jgi:hypothetical protein
MASLCVTLLSASRCKVSAGDADLCQMFSPFPRRPSVPVPLAPSSRMCRVPVRYIAGTPQVGDRSISGRQVRPPLPWAHCAREIRPAGGECSGTGAGALTDPVSWSSPWLQVEQSGLLRPAVDVAGLAGRASDLQQTRNRQLLLTSGKPGDQRL